MTSRTLNPAARSLPHCGSDNMAKILIVDDDLALRGLLRETLEIMGHTVTEAPDGAAALRWLGRESPPDLVITDILMPEKDGIEMIREIVRHYPNMAFIAMSGGGRIARSVYLGAAEQLGAYVSLGKPFSRDELRAAVEDALNQKN